MIKILVTWILITFIFGTGLSWFSIKVKIPPPPHSVSCDCCPVCCRLFRGSQESPCPDILNGRPPWMEIASRLKESFFTWVTVNLNPICCISIKNFFFFNPRMGDSWVYQLKFIDAYPCYLIPLTPPVAICTIHNIRIASGHRTTLRNGAILVRSPSALIICNKLILGTETYTRVSCTAFK